MYKHLLIPFWLILATYSFAQIPRLEWATYHGGTDEDSFRDMARDGSGNIYVIGSTKSTNAISSTGSYQPINAGGCDVYLAKYDKDGNRLWSTYFGGIGDDYGQSIDLDVTGNIFITGLTFSVNGISTTGTHQTNNNGNGDTFVAKFDNNGSRIWGSYHGGSNFDFANDIEVDNLGNPIIIGWTNSSNGIATLGAHQNTYSGQDDVLFAKFNTNGQLQWATYFGDLEFDTGLQVESDGMGNIVISGWTPSLTKIATSGAIQTNYGGNSADVFLAVFNSAGSRLWSTYYGGSGNDYSDALFVTAPGDIYLSGSTSSPNNIATSSAFQANVSIGFDAFLARFSNTGTRLWSTYFGGNDDDTAYRLREGKDGAIYMEGHTKSTDRMATIGAFQPMKSGGQDVFLSKFENNGLLTWSTYYGGSANDFGYGLVIDNEDNIYISGMTEGSISLSTTGSFQPNYEGGIKDGFIPKFATCTNPTLNFKNSGYTCNPVNYVFEFELLGQAPFEIYYSIDGVPQTPWTTNNINFNPIVNATLWKKIIKIDSVKSSSCKGIINSQWGFVQVRDSIRAATPVITCNPINKTYTVTVDLSGGAFGNFSTVGTSGGVISGLNQFVSFPVLYNNPYSVKFIETGTFSNCDTVAFQGLSGCIDPCTNFTVTSSSNTPICAGTTIQLNASGGTTYQWSGPNGFTSNLQNPSISNATIFQSGNYDVTVTDVNNCSATASTNVVINAEPIAILSSNSPVCNGSRISFQLSGGASYQWSGPNSFASTLQNPAINSASNLNSGVYRVTVTGANQCTNLATATVLVSGQLSTSISSNSPVCEKSDITLSASNGASFQWSGPNGFSSLSANPKIPNASISNSGMYQLAVTDQSGCSGTLTLQVVVNRKPKAIITGSDSICIGESVDLTSLNAGTYKWNTGATTNKISAKPNQNALFSLSLTENNCSDTTQFRVVVSSLPNLKITSPITILVGDKANIIVSGGNFYKWKTAEGLSCLNCPNPEVNPIITTTYCVQGSLNKCLSEICTEIIVIKNCNIILPNIFSPNGDNQNDIWCTLKLDCVDSQQLTIYDRWGNIIYSQTGEEVCWDGIFNGQLCQNDVYSYVLQLELQEGEPKIFRGTITLVR